MFPDSAGGRLHRQACGFGTLCATNRAVCVLHIQNAAPNPAVGGRFRRIFRPKEHFTASGIKIAAGTVGRMSWAMSAFGTGIGFYGPNTDPRMNTRLRIAVADDEPVMRKFLYRVLTHEGHDVVVVAESGSQLVRECREKRPDLVITDIGMPELDGLDAIHEICTVESVPAIIVSGNSTRDMVARASRELVFAFLVKPIKMDDLRPAIWLTMHRFYEISRLQLQLQAFL